MNNLNDIKIIFSFIKRKKARFAGTVAIVAVLTFSLLAGGLILFSLKNGIRCLGERMGADLMIVPLDYEGSAEGILIKGEPSYFYLEREVADELSKADIEGIDRISAQFYLTSSNQGCCDIPVQFIGIDEASDFTVNPWIREMYGAHAGLLDDNQIIVGSDIDIPENGEIRFFEKHFKVSAQLEETGTGLDQAVFANMKTIQVLFDAAKNKGFTFPDGINPDKGISSIMIRVKYGYEPSQVKHDIRSKLDGLQVIETRSMTNSIESGLGGFKVLLYLLLSMLLILTVIILDVTFALSINERKDRYDVMKMVGATDKQIRKLILKETLIISFIGSVLGVSLVSIVLFPFKTFISSSVSIPFLIPNPETLVFLFIIAGVIGILAGPVSGRFAVRRIG
ncbi:MAG: ABC transporter permease [Eubacterium sp.]|nr:ABC transporter permease [Eubacterium sp.]